MSTAARSLDDAREIRLTQAERTALSDERMLAAAAELIVERGTEKTTLKEVGERAGYSRGLAGYRFGNKEGLYGSLVRAVGEEWLQTLTRVTQGKAGLEAITAATDAHYRFCADGSVKVRAFYVLWFESISPGSEAKAVIAGVHKRRQRDVVAWIDTGRANGSIGRTVDAEHVATLFCSALVGIIYQWLVEPAALNEIKRLHEELKRTMTILLRG